MRSASKSRVKLAVALACLAGCGPAGPPPRPAVHPVAGRLVLADLPVAGARVAFHPADGGGQYPVGITGPDGTFRLTTFAADDGAPAGDYVVTVVWPNDSIPVDECADPTAHDRLAGRYTDPATSPLRAAVRPGPNSVVLEVTVGSRGWSLPRRREADAQRGGAGLNVGTGF